MHAAFYERTGAAREVLQLGELDDPVPGPGEVRVAIRASGVNPSDVKTRAGFSRPMAFDRVIPHSDGAGVVDMVGHGVPEARLGERVWIWNAAWKRPGGTAAQFSVLPQDQAVALPDGTSFAESACFGIPLLTAIHAIEQARLAAGETVLVAGGAGAVSFYAIQLARAAGARVVATVSSPRKAEIAMRAGVHHTIDYRSQDVGTALREYAPAGADCIIELDFSVNATAALAALAPHGRMIVYGGGTSSRTEVNPRLLVANSISLAFFLVYELRPDDRRRAIERAVALTSGGVLAHNVALTLPLDRIVEAHETVEAGTVAGNVVLQVE